MNRPCKDCPFRREGGVGLLPERKREIADTLVSGGTFHCHKTIDYGDDDGGKVTGKSAFCAGALVTMDNAFPDSGGCFSNQMARMYARFGGFNPDELTGHDLVHADLDEWADQPERYTT